MKKLFIDLDGAVARFNVRGALQRFETEREFFANLLPYKGLETINQMAKEYGNVYIISASPNISAGGDKLIWIRRNLPDVSFSKVILCRIGENKGKALERLGEEITNECYLLDDYTKNLEQWEELGGVGIKRITKCADNSTKKWKGLELRDLRKIGDIM